ncbi:MAG: family transporter substrate-binding protein [Bacillales bacterium]|nr:family transporter substrate-binding protein [Bacillales bacterium]
MSVKLIKMSLVILVYNLIHIVGLILYIFAWTCKNIRSKGLRILVVDESGFYKSQKIWGVNTLKKLGLLLVMMIIAASLLTACGKDKEEGKDSGKKTATPKTEYTVGMVTDLGGIDDKSFNQSAWEGLQLYGKENNLEKGGKGFDYLQSQSDADYATNLNQLSRGNFKLVFGIGFLLADAITEVADQNPNTNFSIVDMVVEKPNVASITFAEHEGSYLVGVVAAMKSKSKHVGFVGGVNMPLIQKFQAGFEAGVKFIDPTIKIDVNYTGSFTDAALGQAAASTMYKAGCDVVYHAAGGSGNGVFTEAKNIKENDPTKEIWVIGVDKDQAPEGLLKDGKTNVTLTSMNLNDEIKTKVKEVTEKIKSGEIKVPAELK